MGAPKPPLPITGSAGAPPPPGAPHEVSQPLAPETLHDQLEKALAHEQELKPLKFPPPKLTAPAPVVGAGTGSGGEGLPKGGPTGGTGAINGVSLKPSAAVAEDSGSIEAIEALITDTEEALIPSVPVVHQPAASTTDSPSRGVPKPIGDPGKQITGGWGESPSQYYALDGSELRTLIEGLMDDLKKQMTTDLRFSLALTYPQVRAKVTITIDGATADAGVNDVKFDLPLARIVTLETLILDDGVTPPDALRDAVGLPKPYKHLVKTGAGKFFADVEV